MLEDAVREHTGFPTVRRIEVRAAVTGLPVECEDGRRERLGRGARHLRHEAPQRLRGAGQLDPQGLRDEDRRRRWLGGRSEGEDDEGREGDEAGGTGHREVDVTFPLPDALGPRRPPGHRGRRGDKYAWEFAYNPACQ